MTRAEPRRLFISYKSEDAQLARAIVEQLLYHGVDCWFAEYGMLSGDHTRLETVRERQGEQAYSQQLHELLRSAVCGCSHGMALTNALWGRSEYCNNEIAMLHEHFGGDPLRILQVAIPEQPMPPMIETLLAGSRKIIQDPADPNVGAIVRFVLSNVAPAVEYQEPAEFRRDTLWEVSERGAWATVQFGQFDVHPETLTEFFDQRHADQARQFAGTIEGVPLRLLITFRAEKTILSPWQLTERRPIVRTPNGEDVEPDASSGIDDRRVNALLREMAYLWYAAHEFEERGCHLYWHGSTGHLAMTYLQPAREADLGAWHRMYVLILEDPVTGQPGEIDLSFTVPFRGGEEQDVFRQFTRIASLLDELVGTLEYHGRPRHNRSLAVLAAVMCAIVGSALGAMCLTPLPFPWNLVVGAVCGLASTPAVLREVRP